jgi:hypothetical protein
MAVPSSWLPMEIRSKKCFNDNRPGKSASGLSLSKAALALPKVDVHFQGNGFLLQPAIKTIRTYI